MPAIRGVFDRRAGRQVPPALAADARLDGRRELLAALNVPLSVSDTPDHQLILLAWQAWGESCPHHLVGDYAFTIWDGSRRALFCARDHIGARPFFYSLTPDRFAFASDIRDILALPGVPDELDEDYAIAALADRSFYRSDRTYLSAIRRLPPGHALIVTEREHRLLRYWHPAAARAVRFATDGEYVAAARELLTRAVADRLRASTPVGVHLSSGLDSSAVAVLAARERRRRGQCMPLGFTWQPAPDPGAALAAEHARIQAVCAQEGLLVRYCPVTVDDALAILKRDPTREPIHLTMTVEAGIQREAAAAGVRLMLSGWGGDESLSFGGRGYNAELLLGGRWWRLLRESRIRASSSLGQIARDALLLLCADRDLGEKRLARRSLRFAWHQLSYLHPALVSRIRLRNRPSRQTSMRSTLLWLWDGGHLAERMESWAAFGAPLGIEYAYPLLDRRLLEFVAGLPREQFVRGPWRRWAMRAAMDGILPPEVCWQPDKSEPVRSARGIATLHQAFAKVGDRLTAGDEWPSRSRYLDMPRLLAQLRGDPGVRLQRRPGKTQRALQFLDF